MKIGRHRHKDVSISLLIIIINMIINLALLL